MDLKRLIFLLLFYLAVGGFASFAAVSPKSVGSRYFRYHGWGSVGLALGAYLILGGLHASAFICFYAFIVLGAWFSIGWFPSFRFSYLALGGAVTLGMGAVIIDSWAGGFLQVGNALLSALILGFSMAAMLLGHWYLVQPKLSIQELRRTCFLLILLIGVRFVFASLVILRLLLPKTEGEIYSYLLSSSPGIFILMRWCWGLLGPLVLAYFVWETVKIRSTQSATGILYVMVLFVLTGEILGQYLTLFWGIPC
jgi:hypothetical protein